MTSRKDEILAKKARLAELKRQRELRQSTSTRQSIGISGDASPGKSAEERRSEIDNLVSSLIDRQRDPPTSPSRRQSRLSTVRQLEPEPEHVPVRAGTKYVTISTQTLEDSEVERNGVVQSAKPVQPQKEYISYTKGVQTEPYVDAGNGTREDEHEDSPVQRRRRSSRWEQERDEQIRLQLRKEIEEEVRATETGMLNGTQQRFPLRPLSENELKALEGSRDFAAFVERSSKVIERALDEEYDLLADYTRTSRFEDEDDDGQPYTRRSHSLKESLQLYSEKHTRRRIVADIQYSPHFNELLLTAYTKNPSAPNEPAGLVLLWNTHAPSRPEYVFHASSDVLSARFSPFHPNLVIGSCYSGQICLWDTRVSGSNGAAVQKTPLYGSQRHTHPVYNISIVGTPNAHNVLTASMDGVVCSWSVDMLTQAQEYLHLVTPSPTKTEELAPTSMSFPSSDPTFFLVGTEEGSIYACHRYDRAGAQAGVDTRIVYRGHSAPVMSSQFHPARGPIDLGDLLLSSSSDWSIKLWRIKPAASSSAAAAVASSTGGGSGPQIVTPLLDIPREDLVYDARWAPHKPALFACVTGAGDAEIFDLTYDSETPVATASPTRGKQGVMPLKGLNKLAWEERRGAHLAVGGLDGIVTIFDVGKGLQAGAGEASSEEWMTMKRMVSRLEGAKG